MTIKKGDIISESSHFLVKDIIGDNLELHQIESGEDAIVQKGYAERLMNSADYFEETVEVTKEDKRDGTPGIRTIWKNIYSSDVFTVCFKKKDKAKPRKQLNDEVGAVVKEFCDRIDTVKNNKKGVAAEAKLLVQNLLSNPILPYVEGEYRVLRGFKKQFDSATGEYMCIDMDLIGKDENVERMVNINTIKYLIYHGVKYVVK